MTAPEARGVVHAGAHEFISQGSRGERFTGVLPWRG